MDPHLVIRIFVFVKSSILGLDIYELSDLIIFMTSQTFLKEKKNLKTKNFANALGFSSFPNPSPFKAGFGPPRLAPLYLANYI